MANPAHLKRKAPPNPRTPESQLIYDEVMPRALAGEDMHELAAKFKIKYNTLRSWRLKAIKNMPKPEVCKDLVSAVAEVAERTAQVEVGQEIIKRNSAAEIKSFLLDNAADAFTLLSKLRGNVLRELSDISESIEQGLGLVKTSLSSGMVTKHAVCDGEVIQCQVKMSPQDLTNTVSTLGKLTNQLASLHNLPLGALNIASIKLDNAPQTHQHMHLHQSYGGDNNPVIGQKPDITTEIVTTPSGEDQMTEWQRALMADEI